MSSYVNDVGEPLMTAAEARFEVYLDEQSMFDRDDDVDSDQGFFEDAYEQQEDGQCPACGEYECTLRLYSDRDEYTGQMFLYHKGDAASEGEAK